MTVISNQELADLMLALELDKNVIVLLGIAIDFVTYWTSDKEARTPWIDKVAEDLGFA